MWNIETGKRSCVSSESTKPPASTAAATHLWRKSRILSRRSGVPNKPMTKNGRKLRTRPIVSVESNSGASGARIEIVTRSEEHTSELQSRFDLVCRLLLEKKKEKRR